MQGLLAIILISPMLCQNALADGIEFESEALKTELCKIVGKEEITVTDLEALSGKIDLSYLNIKSIRGLEYLKNVEHLVLSFNNLTDITPLLGLSNLKSLYLDNNWLKTLPEKSNLSSLEHLDISHNEIESIPSGFFDMPSIRRLYMSDLKLNSPIDFTQMTSTLDRLDVSGNKIDDFSFLNGKNLELLMMNNCGLEELPNLFMMDRLQYLYFANNKINELPEYLGNLPLVRLDFSYNFVTGMPQSFARLSELTQLVFTGNYFRKLPEVVTKLKNLEVLMCGQNIINDVPESIGELENIKRASFAGNELTSLENFRNLNIPYSYQISFDKNYLDFGYETNIEILKRYHNTGGVQKTLRPEANVVSAHTDKLEIDLVQFIDAADKKEELKEVKLFSIKNDIFNEEMCEITQSDDNRIGIASKNQKAGSHDYLVCIVLQETGNPKKETKYTITLEGVSIKERPVASPTVAPTNAIEVAPTATAQNVEAQNDSNYLLYILLFGVIMIVVAYLLQKRSNPKKRKHKRR
jgi:Leucine-rich repeat (LRR) protein